MWYKHNVVLRTCNVHATSGILSITIWTLSHVQVFSVVLPIIHHTGSDLDIWLNFQTHEMMSQSINVQVFWYFYFCVR